jgi:plasmid stabilization system protein ParE
MKYQVVWSAHSESQLDEIFEYYKNKASYLVATKLVRGIISRTNILETTPLAGPVEELLINRTEKYHYLVCGNYKVIYSVDHKSKLVKIADVFDTRQNPTKIQRGQ